LVTELGGPTTQDGIFYQNTLAAGYLADMLELGPQPPKEQVSEVRLEAPSHVDDIVVRYADGHCDWVQAKMRLQSSGSAWDALWRDLATQSMSREFGVEDRLVVVIGEHDPVATGLRDLCERADTALDAAEWRNRLGDRHKRLLEAIERVLGSSTQSLALLRRTTVKIFPLDELERDFNRRMLAAGFTLPVRLLSVLRDIAGGGARRRALFLPAQLRRRLSIEFGIETAEPLEWGLPAYRSTVQRLARIEIPGTSVSGPVAELFVWPRARDYDRANPTDFEDEQPRLDLGLDTSTVELQGFPSERLDRCIVVAGPGFGKSVLLKAVAARLAQGPLVPVQIPLGSFASSEQGVVEFLMTYVNPDFNIRINWARLAEKGLAVLLFDGLDEMPAGRRQAVLGRIATFAARYPSVPWMLTVRDPSALSGPAEARTVELLPLEDTDIMRFADAMKRSVPGLDGWALTRRLETYPDLARLTRIPLFLSILLATWRAGADLPSNRSELIESYLRTLFQPQQHKALPAHDDDSVLLRSIAEALAFERLEKQEIGATERDVRETVTRVSLHTAGTSAVLERLLNFGILRRQSAIRLEFPFPIVQEYLAACYLVQKQPEDLLSRIPDALQRPWAQVMQFALELHPTPSPIIERMLATEDDVFRTRLRLVGRCITNGVRVSPSLYDDVGRRLAIFWDQASFRLRERVGQLITDGFWKPLPADVRSRLSHSWLMNAGAGEIVAKVDDPALTREVLATLLERSLDKFFTIHSMQRAIDRLGDTAFRMYAERARRANTTLEQCDSIAHLVESLDPACLTQGLYLDLALDETLPDNLRLRAFCLGPRPLDSRAILLMERALRSERPGDHFAAMRALSLTNAPDELVLRYMVGSELDDQQKLVLVMNLKTLLPDHAMFLSFIHRSTQEPGLAPPHRDMMLAYAARHGDRASFENLVARLDNLPLDMAGVVIALFGHHPSRDLGAKAAELIHSRNLNGAEAAAIAQRALYGMTLIYEMDGFDSGALRDAPPHPALDVWVELVDEWTDRHDLSIVQRLKLLTAASGLGSMRALDTLQRLLPTLPSLDSPEFDEDDLGQDIRSAIRELRSRRRFLPLDVANRFARENRPDVPFEGIAMLAAHSTREALDVLVSLYNDIDDWATQGVVLESIETLSGRLGLTVKAEGGYLSVT
jgi:hypothetical protein